MKDGRFPVLNFCYEKWKDRNVFAGKSLIALQPLFVDSYNLLVSLKKCGLNIDVVLGLRYSSKEEIVEKLRDEGINTVVGETDDMEEVVAQHLHSSIQNAKSTDRKLLILENGGYLVPAYHKYFRHEANICLGGVEETKNGLWRVQQIQELLFPVFETADTRIKKIESSHLGEPVCNALSHILKATGLTIQGKKVGVMGYGWVGSAVARSLKSRHAVVCVYDIDVFKLLSAYYEGFLIGQRDWLLENSDIIIGATGKTSVDENDFQKLKSNVFLASASSKNIEFNLGALKLLSHHHQQVETYIDSFHFSDNKVIHLLNKGEPINFQVESMPNEIMDLMMANMFMCLVQLAQNTFEPGIISAPDQVETSLVETWFSVRK
jgi:adenosylhomocysteinase